MVARPMSSSRLSCAVGLLLRSVGNFGNSIPGNREGSLIFSLEAKTELLWMWPGPSCFLWIGDGCVGELLELQLKYEGTFGSSRG